MVEQELFIRDGKKIHTHLLELIKAEEDTIRKFTGLQDLSKLNETFTNEN